MDLSTQLKPPANRFFKRPVFVSLLLAIMFHIGLLTVTLSPDIYPTDKNELSVSLEVITPEKTPIKPEPTKKTTAVEKEPPAIPAETPSITPEKEAVTQAIKTPNKKDIKPLSNHAQAPPSEPIKTPSSHWTMPTQTELKGWTDSYVQDSEQQNSHIDFSKLRKDSYAEQLSKPRADIISNQPKSYESEQGTIIETTIAGKETCHLIRPDPLFQDELSTKPIAKFIPCKKKPNPLLNLD